MKLKSINRLIILFGILTLLTGIGLHVWYPYLRTEFEYLIFVTFLHILSATLLVTLVVFHIIKNKWWFKVLKYKIKKARGVFQLIFAILVVASLLALIATAVMMPTGEFDDTHIWIWHYILGIVWAVIAVGHALIFQRRNN